MVRDSLTKRELEEQRKQAVEILERGFEPKEVSEILGVAVRSVRQWRSTYEEQGIEGLEAVPHKGSNIGGEDTLPERSKTELESRRKEAIRLLKRGFTISEVSYIFDVTESTVRHWRRDFKSNGMSALESSKNRRNNDINNKLEEISSDYLRNILDEIEDNKPTQRLIIALYYKENDDITESDLADIMGVSIATIHDWLQRVIQTKKRRSHETIYDTEPEWPGPDKKLSIEELSNLEKFLENGPAKYGFDGDIWTGEKVVNLIENKFDKSITKSTGRKYLRDINWKEKKMMEQAIFDFVNIFEIDANNYQNRNLKEIEYNKLMNKFLEICKKPTKRLTVAILYKSGVPTSFLSDWFEITEGTVLRWIRQIESEPLSEAIYDDKKPGRGKKLTEKEFDELEIILKNGPKSYGFTGQIWTSTRLITVIEEEFGTKIGKTTACNYLHHLNWSHKKPTRVAVERDKEEIVAFRNDVWPKIRDKCTDENKNIVFVDETKFRLLPTFKKTWAPKGERATIETKSSFEYIAVIGALIYTPATNKFTFSWNKQRYNYNSESVISFFKYILNNIPSKSVFLLDNWAPHTSAIEELKEEYSDEKNNIEAEYFPAYSSDLNPVDRIWGQVKYNDLPNYAPKNLDDLSEKIEVSLNNKEYDEKFLQSCIEYAGLELNSSDK